MSEEAVAEALAGAGGVVKPKEATWEAPPQPQAGKRTKIHTTEAYVADDHQISYDGAESTPTKPKDEEPEVDAGSKRLVNRLKKMCDRIVSDFDKHDPEVGFQLRSISVQEGDCIAVADLEKVLRAIGVSSEQLITDTVQDLDSNKDGLIGLDDVALVCENALKIEEEKA